VNVNLRRRQLHSGMSDDQVEAAERETLHGLTLRRLREQGKPLQPLGRLCIVGVGASSGPGSASSWHERALRSVAADADADDAHAPLTGLFLALPTGWIHFVEGSLPGLSAYVRLLREEEQQAGGAVRGVKVASCMDDVPNHAFSRWNMTKLEVSRNNYVEVPMPPSPFCPYSSASPLGRPTALAALACCRRRSPHPTRARLLSACTLRLLSATGEQRHPAKAAGRHGDRLSQNRQGPRALSKRPSQPEAGRLEE
jgi:hypothetical protein